MDKKSKGTPITINSVVDGSFCVTIEGTRICNDPSDQAYSSSHIRVADAMKYSLNTTFDQMAQQVGPNNVAATAHAAGISKTINGKPSLQNADGQTTFGIGIGDYPVHPIDQANGFATFANGGTANQPYFVRSATASDGEVVYRHHGTGTRAMDPKVANDVTLTLEPIAGVLRRPARRRPPVRSQDRDRRHPVGKHKGGNSDAWMVGFTPQVATAVWVGSGNSTSPIVNSYGAPEYGRDLPGQAWKLFMDTFLAGQAGKLPMPTKQLIGTPRPRRPPLRPHRRRRRPRHRPDRRRPRRPRRRPRRRRRVRPAATDPDAPPPTPTCSPGLVLPNCSSRPPSSSPAPSSSSSSSAAAAATVRPPPDPPPGSSARGRVRMIA